MASGQTIIPVPCSTHVLMMGGGGQACSLAGRGLRSTEWGDGTGGRQTRRARKEGVSGRQWQGRASQGVPGQGEEGLGPGGSIGEVAP